MTDSWEETRKSLRKLKTIWQEADDDTKYDIAFWLIGLALMGLAIVAHFGSTGALFCMGLLIWKAGCVGVRKTK